MATQRERPYGRFNYLVSWDGLDERGVQFDAVVAADDAMALGAMEALRARGIRGPQRVQDLRNF